VGTADEALEDALSFLALVGAERPSPHVRARVLAAARGQGRLRAHAAMLAEHFRIPLQKALDVLDGIDDDASWEEGLLPGMGFIHVSPGPELRLGGADTHLVRLPAGLEWPRHRHGGEERHLVLDGAIADSRTGRDYFAGETLVSPRDSEHSFRVHEGVPCVGAIVLFGEIEFG
jgi:hypothetical protein